MYVLQGPGAPLLGRAPRQLLVKTAQLAHPLLLLVQPTLLHAQNVQLATIVLLGLPHA
jgi:hypothetical protein